MTVSPAEGAVYVIYVNCKSVQLALSGLNKQVFAGRQLRIRPVEDDREGQLVNLVSDVLQVSLEETKGFLHVIEGGEGTKTSLGEVVGGSVVEKLVSDTTTTSEELKLSTTTTMQTNMSLPYVSVDTSDSLGTNTNVSMAAQTHFSQAMGQLNSLGVPLTSQLSPLLSTSSTLIQFTLPTFSSTMSHLQPGIYSLPNHTPVPTIRNYLTMPLSTYSGPRCSTRVSQPRLQAQYPSSSLASGMVQPCGNLPLSVPPYQRPVLSHFSGIEESAVTVKYRLNSGSWKFKDCCLKALWIHK